VVASPAFDPVRELTEQLEARTLMVKSLSKAENPAVSSTPISAPPPGSFPSGSFPHGPQLCIWCDSTEHLHKECPSFDTAFQSGGIAFNNQGRVILVSTGQEFVPAYGRGGMKASYESQQQAPMPVRQVRVNAISFDEGYGSGIGVRTSAVKDDGWVDVGIDEKRKRDGMDFGRKVRPKNAPILAPNLANRAPIPALGAAS
jgi:hypothetical protein